MNVHDSMTTIIVMILTMIMTISDSNNSWWLITMMMIMIIMAKWRNKQNRIERLKIDHNNHPSSSSDPSSIRYPPSSQDGVPGAAASRTRWPFGPLAYRKVHGAQKCQNGDSISLGEISKKGVQLVGNVAGKLAVISVKSFLWSDLGW